MGALNINVVLDVAELNIILDKTNVTDWFESASIGDLYYGDQVTIDKVNSRTVKVGYSSGK